MTHTSGRSSSTLHALAAAGSALFMGTIGPIAAYSGLRPETVTFFRLLLGWVFMSLFILLRGKRSTLKIAFSPALLASGVFLAGFIVVYIQAMRFTTMANAIVTIYLAPLAASAGAHFLFGERLSRRSVFLIGLALGGFLMLREFDLGFGGSENDFSWKGTLLALTAMVFYSLYILANRIIPRKIHVFSRTWYQFLTGSLVMLPFFLLRPEPVSPAAFGWLLAAGLVPGFLAILLAVTALESLPAAVFGTLAYMEPITVMVLGWVLFGQSLSILQLSGSAVIIGCGIIRALIPEGVRPAESPSPASAGTNEASSG